MVTFGCHDTFLSTPSPKNITETVWVETFWTRNVTTGVHIKDKVSKQEDMADKMDFNNTEIAFDHRSTQELLRAKLLFGTLGHGWLMDMARPLLELAFKLRLPIAPIIKKTIFSQFCGGENLEECKNNIGKLYDQGRIKSILDYSVEGSHTESGFDDNLNTLLQCCSFSQNQKHVPFLVFKPSALGTLELYQKISQNVQLTPLEQEQWGRTVKRFEKICETVANTDTLRVMVDAEESWGQSAVDQLVENMMVRFNEKRTVVFTTVQLYLASKYDYLLELKELGDRFGIKVGVKLVRGAYMEKEAHWAKERNLPNPVCQDKSTTDRNFDQGMDYVLENLNGFELFLGTHNEKSCLRAVDKLQQQNLDPSDIRIWFGQLYGMGDNIGHIMARNGYNVAKYVPYGPVREVMPYLIRRVRENSSVGSQSSRELQLIKRELTRRKQVKANSF